jgi:hypothetical protein
MKFAPVVLSSLLFAAAQAAAQAPTECPSLPASSGLQWQQQAQADFWSAAPAPEMAARY